jgi:surface antigen
MHWWNRTLLALTSSWLLLTGNAAPALAASGDYGRVSGSAPHLTCPDTRCGAVTSPVPDGTWVQVWCWRDAGSYGGSPRWFRSRYAGTDGWIPAAAMPTQPSVPYCSDVRPNEALFANQSVWSSNGAYRIIMQGDGNLVLYTASGSALWSTRTAGVSGAWAIVQGDGNFVVYNNSNQPVWHTGTFGNSGSWLNVQTDGNVVLYTASNQPLYASSWHRTVGDLTSGNQGAAGNCTWYAQQRFHDYSGFWPNFYVAGTTNNAGTWANNARTHHWNVQGTPSTHSIVVFPGEPGHVAWVEGVHYHSDGSLWIDIAEMNYYGLYVVDQRTVQHLAGMQYITAPSL